MKQPVSSKQRALIFRRDPTAPRNSNGSADKKPDKPKDKVKRRRYLRQYYNWLWPFRWGLGSVLVLAIVAAGFDLVWPMIIGALVNIMLAGGSTGAGNAGHMSPLLKKLLPANPGGNPLHPLDSLAGLIL